MPDVQPVYLDFSEADLDRLIGEALVADEFGAKDMSDTEKAEIGRRWFALRLPDIRAAVCGSQATTALFGPGTDERNLLFAAVVDALAALGGFPVPVTVLAAKVMKYGVNQLCGPAVSPQPA